ncbi:MAG: ribonuclease P protein subunit [Candidatus Saliniplasma sp.]
MKNFNVSIYQEELIGSKIEVIDANHSGYRGIVGTIIDETKNTLIIENQIDDKEKMIPKIGINFRLTRNDHKYLLNGDRLNNRPEERIKKSG